MTGASSHDTFTDRRTEEETSAMLATQVLFWYDKEGRGKKRRRRVNGLAVSTDGQLIYAEATCSRKDQFVKAQGRLVVSKRIMGRAKKHCYVLTLDDKLEAPVAAVAAFRALFPDNAIGIKRAYNAGRVFARYRQDISQRADEMMDDTNG